MTQEDTDLPFDTPTEPRPVVCARCGCERGDADSECLVFDPSNGGPVSFYPMSYEKHLFVEESK